MAGLPKYYYEVPEISEEDKKTFSRYTKIPENEVIEHIKNIRQRAWALLPYPCIGVFTFANSAIQGLPVADQVLSRMTSGKEALLDLGCCFGQEIRHLVIRGAPQENMTGFELRREFVDLGFELFQDRNTLKSKILVGDFFDPDCGLEKGAFDLIHAEHFFSLFNWQEQFEALSKAVGLLKAKKGSVIFGRQVGAEQSARLVHHQSRSGEAYRQNSESFKALVSEVASNTGMRLAVDSTVSGMKDPDLKREGFRIFTFCITVTGQQKQSL